MNRRSLFKSFTVVLSACFLTGGTAVRDSFAVAPTWGGNPKAEAQYAPDRKIDITHLALDVTPDFEKRTVKGQATFTFNPIAKPLKELKLNGVDLSVDSVSGSDSIASFESTDKDITISFAPPLPVGKESKLIINYSAQPNMGLYFRVPSNGYKSEQMHIFTQGEMIEARHWFPCYDHPNDKFTSEITCRVPDNLIVISNGKRISVTKDAVSGLTAHKWLQDKPHVNYLITLVAGKFEKLDDKYGNIPLEFYYLNPEKPQAELAFKDTKNMMQFFERETGLEYPWAKYGQVVVTGFYPSGMENTSLTTLNDFLLQSAEEENTDIMGAFTSEEIVAHELAHQWWGDLVTCKDWSHAWLNEGFATYYASLFLGNKYGKDRLTYDFLKSKEAIFEHKEDWRPIVNRRYEDPWEQFDHRAYQKAAWVIRMLKAELGDDLFKKVVTTYLDRYKYQTVVTANLQSVIEEVSGRNFDRFFEQWLYKPGFPELSVFYNWNEENKLAKISVNQNHKRGDEKARGGSADADRTSKSEPLLYHLPLTVRFKTRSETVEKQLEITNRNEDFYISLKEMPTSVQVDPDIELLADIDFSPPTTMLYKQLCDNSDAAGRLLAAQRLADKSDDTTITKLKEALKKDSFYGVRIRAAQSLREIHNDNALDALIDSRNQNDARVRLAVLQNLGKFFHPRCREALLDSLKAEKNPRVIAEALKGLGPYHTSAVRDTITKNLATDSYHNIIADGAIGAIRQQDDPYYVPILLQAIKDKEDRFDKYSFQNALETLAYIDRNEKNRDEVREYLSEILAGKRDFYKSPAINALGKLEDPKAIPILETFEHSNKNTNLQKPAQWALNNLRWNNKPHDNLQDLRDQVLELQKSNRELKKEFDDLKSKFKALKSPVSASPAKGTPATRVGEAKGTSTAVRAERLRPKSK